MRQTLYTFVILYTASVVANTHNYKCSYILYLNNNLIIEEDDLKKSFFLKIFKFFLISTDNLGTLT